MAACRGLTIGASEETADTILPFLLNRIGCFYPRMTLEIKVHPHAAIMEMLARGVDLALTTHQPPGFTALTLRTSPTLWYCAAEYVLAKGESIP
jgi:DNA-binding transcriptional LysR family regulator